MHTEIAETQSSIIYEYLGTDTSFIVTLHFDVSDTIFPTLTFSEHESVSILDLSYNISENNVRSSVGVDVEHINISLPQSYAKQYI